MNNVEKNNNKEALEYQNKLSNLISITSRDGMCYI